MSVSGIYTADSNAPATGSVQFKTTSAALLSVVSDANSFTVSPLQSGVTTFNGGQGPITLASSNLAITKRGLVNTYDIFTYNAAGAGSACLVGQNVTGALAWLGTTASTAAYAEGDLVIYSPSTYVCLTPQPIGSPPPPNGSAWVAIGGGGGSSISGGQATVACDDPTGSGSIKLTTAGGSIGAITFDTTQPEGPITLSSGGEVIVDTTNGASGSGLKILTTNTTSLFEDTLSAGVVGQIRFTSADTTNPAQLTIGGASNATGLYVSNTQLLFNGAAVGSGGGGTSIANGGSTLAIDASGAMTYTPSTEPGATNNISLSSGASGNAGIRGNSVSLSAPAGTPTGILTVSDNSISAVAGGSTLGIGADGSLSFNGGVVGTNTGNVTLLARNVAETGALVLGGDVVTLEKETGSWFKILANADIQIQAAPNQAVSIQADGLTGAKLTLQQDSFFLDSLIVGGGGTGEITSDTVTIKTAPGPAQSVILLSEAGDVAITSAGAFTFNGEPVANANPVTNPQRGDNNEWVSGIAYAIGSVVYSPTVPYNWFICYVAVPAGPSINPQADVDAGADGQGTYWQLLAPAGLVGRASGKIIFPGLVQDGLGAASFVLMYWKQPTSQPVAAISGNPANWCIPGVATNPTAFTNFCPCSLKGYIPADPTTGLLPLTTDFNMLLTMASDVGDISAEPFGLYTPVVSTPETGSNQFITITITKTAPGGNILGAMNWLILNF
jgi:hypothetical protein